VLGIAGWSGSGKTTLIVKLIPLLAKRGLRVATLKHAHHAFDVDVPGKDSYEHRKAGACEVIVSSARRWVQMHEIGGDAEATLPELLARLSPWCWSNASRPSGIRSWRCFDRSSARLRCTPRIRASSRLPATGNSRLPAFQ
jgi:hypothetical protein